MNSLENCFTRRPTAQREAISSPLPEDTWLTSTNIHRWIARFDTPSPWESDPPLRLYACDDLLWLAAEHLSDHP